MRMLRVFYDYASVSVPCRVILIRNNYNVFMVGYCCVVIVDSTFDCINFADVYELLLCALMISLIYMFM